VGAVLSDPAQPFARILFGPPVDIYSLRFVLVGTSTPLLKPIQVATTTVTSKH